MTTLGAARVRLSFNPSDNNLVDEFKHETAKLINLCEAQRRQDTSGFVDIEVARLWSLAQTAYEEAAMWAVKAATA